MIKKGFIIVLICIAQAGTLNAQNIDLTEGKEFSELAQTNPAFSGVLEQLRFLFTQSNELKAGLESKVLKNNYLSFHFNQDEIEQLKRQRFSLSYSRDKVFESGLTFKYAGNFTYNNKSFFRDIQQNEISFTDFNGFKYTADSSNFSEFSSIESYDLGIGLGFLYKNLVAGINISNINSPNVSVLSTTENKLPLEINAQIGGFLNISDNFRIFPNGLFAFQGDEYWVSAGMGIIYKMVSFNTQYEKYNDFDRVDLGITAKIDRFLLGLSVTNYINSPGISGSEQGIRLTLNGSIFKPKKSLSGILKNLQTLY